MDCNVVIGIYGVSGCGKSRLLASIRESRPEWRCLEGSEVIGMIMNEQGEDFDDFHDKSEFEKDEIRQRAVKMIQSFPGVTVVAGHCSFPELGTEDSSIAFKDVFTKNDGETYDGILYLDKEPSTVYGQREQDNETSKRLRQHISLEALDQWIEHEKCVLQNECDKHGIKFSLVSDDTVPESHICQHFLAPLVNKAQAESELNLKEAIRMIPPADVFLLIDGDRTLCPLDTGKVFVDQVLGSGSEDPLKKIFKRHDSYTFQAFLEVAMFYANVQPTQNYKDVSGRIGRENVSLYSEWTPFLTNLPPHVHAIVLTSGNRELWKTVIDTNILDNATTLLAGNHVGLHSYIIDSHAKAMVVKELRDLHKGCKIVSFGDSAIDIPMMRISDEAYVIIDTRHNRSMKGYIREMVQSGDARHLYQVNLIEGSSFLHDGIQVGSLERLGSSFADSSFHGVLDCAMTSVAAKLLASQSRRSDIQGPALQGVHIQIGQFLADKLLDEVGRLGLLVDHSTFSHVQGTIFDGMVTSEHVAILPLMRGGEPLSRGVYQRFPRAKLIHYNDKDTSNNEVLESTLGLSSHIKDVIVVDSVVNEGRSIRRTLSSLKDHDVRIYVLTAVMQHDASLQLSKEFRRVRFIVLRVSENKYTGKGGTDTGNRLFGTY